MRSAIIISLLGMFSSLALPAIAQNAQVALEEIIVTATRRDEVLTRVPFNITAITSENITSKRMDRISDLGRWVPGLTVVNQGPRQANAVTVRGLNVTSSASPDELNNGNGGTVATYIGDIPLYLDLKLKDIERVEVLLGPQGTLYGAGTIGGAIRYIPKKPDSTAFSSEVHARGYSLAHSSGAGFDGDVVLNVPVVEDKLALRGVFSYRDDPGFIDMPFLVQTPGVSLPDPELNGASAADNLRTEKDVNTEKTFSTRIAARWTPTEDVDATLTYIYQQQKVGGRQISNRITLNDFSDASDYVSAVRLPEPSERETNLIALEAVVDFDWAELTSATGYGTFDQTAQRGITDFLLNFEDGFEFLPSFVGLTRELAEENRFNQELRLVSADDGPLTWIAGAFYNHFSLDVDDREFTPGISEFFGLNRPDNLEYIQIDTVRREETALFGEITYALNDRWRVTGGLRWFDYNIESSSGFDIPLFNGDPTAIFLDTASNTLSDNGFTYKLNTSFDLSDTTFMYATLSEGYRVGGANAVPTCPPGPLSPFFNLCGLPNELEFTPDRTLNKEIGIRGTLVDGRMTAALALYHIDWTDIQVVGSTVNGFLPITTNGNDAVSQGFELSAQGLLSESLTLSGSYAYADAHLSEDAPFLVGGADAFNGDRLPGTPKYQISLGLYYSTELSGGYTFDAQYGMTYTSAILTRVGERNFGESLPGYDIHQASLTLSRDNWEVSLFADNLFDQFAVTAVRGGRDNIRNVSGIPLRFFAEFVGRPRVVGLDVRYKFGS